MQRLLVRGAYLLARFRGRRGTAPDGRQSARSDDAAGTPAQIEPPPPWTRAFAAILYLVVFGVVASASAFIVYSAGREPSDGLLTTVAQVDAGLLIALVVEGGRTDAARFGAAMGSASIGTAIVAIILLDADPTPLFATGALTTLAVALMFLAAGALIFLLAERE